MNAGKILINGIFNGSQLLVVPFYQRAYVWKEEQWERFLEDMEFITRTKKPYFLGSIILKNGKSPATWETFSARKIVIDGQQRLTTLMIFMKVLCLKKRENKLFDRDFRLEDDKITLQHGLYDAKAFDTVMGQKEPVPISGDVSASQIIAAYHYFLEHMDVEKVDRSVIKQFVQFVCIDLDDGEDEQQVFDTINSLGVRLTTAELLKNYFFHRDNREAFEQQWANVFEKDAETKAYWEQEIDAGRYRRSMIDLFFDAYFQMFLQDKSYSIKTEDRIAFARTDRLSKSYQEFISIYCRGDKNAVLAGMADYAKCFRRIFRPDYCDKAVPAALGIERLNIVMFGLKNTTFIPYVLYVAMNCGDESEASKIYGLLEAYIMRRMIVRAQNKNYNKMIETLIADKVLRAEQLADVLAGGEDATTYVPDDRELRIGFHESKLTNLQTRGILYLLESHIRPATSAVMLMGFNQYSLEHMMPKKWRNKWAACETSDLERERDAKLLTLGNLAIIPQALNASICESRWEDKLKGKGDNGKGLKECAAGLSTMYDALEKRVWNETEIVRRADWLCDCACKTWSMGEERFAQRKSVTEDEARRLVAAWGEQKEGVTPDPVNCNKTYFRFTTPGMNSLFPEAETANSGWKTRVNYFYEIVIYNGKIYTQLAFSGKNMPPEQRALCEQIHKQFPGYAMREKWQWYAAYVTERAKLARIFSEEAFTKLLDEQFCNVMHFERELLRMFGGQENREVE